MITIPIYQLNQITDERWNELMAQHHDKNLSWFMSTKEFAEKCGVTYHTVLNWIKSGLIPYEKRQAGGLSWFLIPKNATRPKLKTGPKTKSSAKKY